VSQRVDFALDLRGLEKDLREMGSQMPVMMLLYHKYRLLLVADNSPPPRIG